MKTQFKEFEKLAKKKGMSIKSIQSPDKKLQTDNEVHIDLDLMDLSIEDAIRNAVKMKEKEIIEELKYLLKNGTVGEKLEFVFGEGNYIFPRNLKEFNNAKAKRHIYTLVCTLVGFLQCFCSRGKLPPKPEPEPLPYELILTTPKPCIDGRFPACYPRLRKVCRWICVKC